MIYFTTDTSRLLPADRTATADNGFGAGPLPIAGSTLYTGLGLNNTPGTVASLAGSPSFIVALYGGTSSNSLSVQTTTTIADVNAPGGIVPVDLTFATFPAGTPVWFQVQVYDSRDANANAAMNAGHYYGTSLIFQATPQNYFAPIYLTTTPINSSWEPGTFVPTDLVQLGGGCFGGIMVQAVVAQAQWDYMTYGDGIEIVRYTGPGGDVIIPSTINGLPVTTIGYIHSVFGNTGVTSVTIPSSVTWILGDAFYNCTSLTAAYFLGNAPSTTFDVFRSCFNLTVYYLPGTTGWGSTFGWRPAVLATPSITTQPASQTLSQGDSATFSMSAVGLPPLFYQWRFNGTDIALATTSTYSITNAQLTDAGSYSVIITNALGTITSHLAILQVLPPGAPSIQVNNEFAVGTVLAVGPAQLTLSGGFTNGFMFYTLDGTTPTTSSPFYTGPVTLTNSAIVQAMSLSADFTQTAFAPAVVVQIIPVYNLQISVVGSGTISASPTNGPYASNTVVVLTANAAAGWALDHWTGAVTGNQNPASVTMNGSRTVQAVFVQTAYPLTAATPGGGTVSVNG